jgi:sulfur carrier protein
VKAKVNGEVRELADGMTIAALLDELGVPRAGIAVAMNESVIRRADYDSSAIADGDAVEIIKAVAGG